MSHQRNGEMERPDRDSAWADRPVDQVLADVAQRYAEGSLAEAMRLATKALERNPGHPGILNALGIVEAGMGRQSAAIEAFRLAVAAAPDVGTFRANLALALRHDARADEAAAQAREAVRLEPANAAFHAALGAAALAARDVAEALAASRRAVRLDPRLAEGWHNFASALLVAGAFERAEHGFRTAAQLAPSSADSWVGLGQARMALGLDAPTAEAFGKALALRRRSRWWPSLDAPGPARARRPATTNTVKLRHDVEQLQYLADLRRLPDGAEHLVAAYEEVLTEFLATHGPLPSAELTERQWEAIGDAYDRVLVWNPPSCIGGSALGDFDRSSVAKQFDTPPGVCWIDGFLSAAALEGVRRFCLESTIWNDASHNFQGASIARGYLGSYVNDGFAAPLLFQIQRELAQALPSIFRTHRLMQMWAYKYEAALEGIALHGDDAAVNVNFWITPDSANLDPSSGGLLVHPVEAPAEWSFDEMNKDQPRIVRFLEEAGIAPIEIPYRQNRAVIFNSDLFHATAPLRFRPGYENRRINVTMLFGQRGG